MSDRELQDRIIKFLNSKPKKKEAAAKIIQALRVPKKNLNNQIYRLQREGRVIKCVESPPVWGLPSGTVSSLPVATRRSKRVSGDSSTSEKVHMNIEIVVCTLVVPGYVYGVLV